MELLLPMTDLNPFEATVVYLIMWPVDERTLPCVQRVSYSLFGLSRIYYRRPTDCPVTYSLFASVHAPPTAWRRFPNLEKAQILQAHAPRTKHTPCTWTRHGKKTAQDESRVAALPSKDFFFCRGLFKYN